MAAVARSMAGRLGTQNEEKEALQEASLSGPYLEETTPTNITKFTDLATHQTTLHQDIMNAILEDDDEYLNSIISPPCVERPKYNDAELNSSALTKAVIKLTTPAYEVAYGQLSPYFDTFIFVVIILAGGMVGVQVRVV